MENCDLTFKTCQKIYGMARFMGFICDGPKECSRNVGPHIWLVKKYFEFRWKLSEINLRSSQ